MAPFDTSVVLQAGHIQTGMPKMYIATRLLSLACWCSQSAESYLPLGPEAF